MGFSLKKLGRGIRKIAKKNRGGFGRLVKKVGPGLVLTAAGGIGAAPLIAKAASAAKSLGKKVRGLETPKSLVPIIRAAKISAKRKRQRMPGGAPIIGPVQVRSVTRSTPQAKRSLYTTARGSTRRKKGTTKSGRPRKPASAKQLAARAKFAAMARARAKARKAA